MENPKKVFFTLLFLFIVSIFLFNFFVKKQQSIGREVEKQYFKEYDLKLKGIVCIVEEQTDTYKFIIGLEVFESNYKEYPLKISGTDFCIKKNNYAAFADHNKNYAIGDTVLIGFDENYLIKCINKNLKFVRNRNDMMLYKTASPNNRMKEIVSLGCNLNEFNIKN